MTDAFDEIRIPWPSLLRPGDVIVSAASNDMVVRRPIPEANLHVGCKKNSDRLEAEILRLTQKLGVLQRPVNRADLARQLFIARMMAAYGITSDAAHVLWDKLTGPYRAEWLAVADVAITQLLATDL